MVNYSPPESDPRPNVERFLKDPEEMALAGWISEGLGTLFDVLKEEILRQEPGSHIIQVDREFLADNRIYFPREFEAFLDKEVSDHNKVVVIIAGKIPVQEWNLILRKFKDRGLKAFYGDLGLHYVPTVIKVRM